jgi:hypothetical protein
MRDGMEIEEGRWEIKVMDNPHEMYFKLLDKYEKFINYSEDEEDDEYNKEYPRSFYISDISGREVKRVLKFIWDNFSNKCVDGEIELLVYDNKDIEYFWSGDEEEEKVREKVSRMFKHGKI